MSSLFISFPDFITFSYLSLQFFLIEFLLHFFISFCLFNDFSCCNILAYDWDSMNILERVMSILSIISYRCKATSTKHHRFSINCCIIRLSYVRLVLDWDMRLLLSYNRIYLLLKKKLLPDGTCYYCG